MRPGLAKSIALSLSLAASLPAAGGSLRGRVILPPPPLAHGSPAPLGYFRLENGRLPTLAAPSWNGPVALALEPATASAAPPRTETAEIRPARIEPRLVIAQAGGRLILRNRDNVAHTVLGASPELGLSRTAVQPNSTLEVVVPRPGEYRILDGDDPHAGTTVLSLPSPYAVRADDKGSFQFDVPDGKYTLRIWHHGTWLEGQSVEVTSRGSGDLVLRVALPTPNEARGDRKATRTAP